MGNSNQEKQSMTGIKTVMVVGWVFAVIGLILTILSPIGVGINGMTHGTPGGLITSVAGLACLIVGGIAGLAGTIFYFKQKNANKNNAEPTDGSDDGSIR